MITKKLKELVRAEADNLRKHATEEERELLEFTSLKPHHSGECIYGQMTGYCHGKRAIELLNKCASPYSTSITTRNNKHSQEIFDVSQGHTCRTFSPIEFYITQPNAKNAALIAYLKGNTDTLTL